MKKIISLIKNQRIKGNLDKYPDKHKDPIYPKKAETNYKIKDNFNGQF